MRPPPHQFPSDDPMIEAANLTARLRRSGLPYLLVDRLLGRTRLGSLFLAIDGRVDRPVVVKLIDPDLAYDVGATEFLRGIGAGGEVRAPHVLDPEALTEGRGTLCYVSPFVPGHTLRERLDGAEPMTVAEAFRIAAEVTGALGYWHIRDEAHGEFGPNKVLLQSGQVVVVPPGSAGHGAQARQADIRAAADLALRLWHRAAPAAEVSAKFATLLATLRAAADQDAPTLLSALQISDLLGRAAEEAERRLRKGLLSRWFGRS